MQIWKSLFGLLLLVCAFRSAAADAENSVDLANAVDHLIESRLAKDGPPGFVLVTLQRGDNSAEIRTYGIADLEQSRNVVDASIFPYASITKSYTSIAILLLQQEGKLSVSDTLERFLPDFPNAKNITIHDLLVHTSGIAEFTAIPAFAKDQQRNWTPQELEAMIAAAPPLRAPQQACVYSDSGYILLGLVVEKVSGQPFMDFVRNRISIPLDMSSVQAGSNSDIVRHRVGGYVRKSDMWENAPNVSFAAPWAAGGLVGEAGDLIKLARVLWDGGTLLHPADLASMTAPVILSDGKPCQLALPGATATYGYGLEIVRFDDLPDHRAIGKSGVFPGYSGYYAIFEGTDLAIAALSNEDGSLQFAVETVHEVAKLLLSGSALP